jgi:transcription elongation factor Elf1
MAQLDPPTQTWQPPQDYYPVESTVPGISIWAPLLKTEKMDTPTTFTCPKCGASTQYNVSSGGVACEHCGFTASVVAQKVGQRAETFEFTLSTLSQAQQGYGVERRQLHCDSCGAEFAVAETALTSTCPFCASNKVNISSAPSEQLRPRFLIPFKVQADALKARVSEWLGKGWFHPSDLAKMIVIDRFTGVYLPFWTFSAHIASSWKAEVGYERTVRRYNASTKSWESHTVIDWRWENGQVGLDVADLPICGSTFLSRVILEKLQPFNLNELVTYSPDFLAGWQAHAYNLTLPTAWEQGKATMRERAKIACYADIHSSHVRNFTMTADFADEAWRYILLPVYIAAYKYEEKIFQVMVNGQNAVVAGQKPVAWWKVWLAIGLIMAPSLLAGLIGIPLLLAGGVGVVPLVISIVLLVIGAVISYQIYHSAVASEAS